MRRIFVEYTLESCCIHVTHAVKKKQKKQKKTNVRRLMHVNTHYLKLRKRCAEHGHDARRPTAAGRAGGRPCGVPRWRGAVGRPDGRPGPPFHAHACRRQPGCVSGRAASRRRTRGTAQGTAHGTTHGTTLGTAHGTTHGHKWDPARRWRAPCCAGLAVAGWLLALPQGRICAYTPAHASRVCARPSMRACPHVRTRARAVSTSRRYVEAGSARRRPPSRAHMQQPQAEIPSSAKSPARLAHAACVAHPPARPCAMCVPRAPLAASRARIVARRIAARPDDRSGGGGGGGRAPQGMRTSWRGCWMQGRTPPPAWLRARARCARRSDGGRSRKGRRAGLSPYRRKMGSLACCHR